MYGIENIDNALESILTTGNSDMYTTIEKDERDYFEKVVCGIKEHESEIDNMILSKLKNWTIDRIFKIDLAILRLAIYEIMYYEDMPVKVAVNEAVELAKKYGNDSSANFVNGVLREVIKEKEK